MPVSPSMKSISVKWGVCWSGSNWTWQKWGRWQSRRRSKQWQARQRWWRWDSLEIWGSIHKRWCNLPGDDAWQAYLQVHHKVKFSFNLGTFLGLASQTGGVSFDCVFWLIEHSNVLQDQQQSETSKDTLLVEVRRNAVVLASQNLAWICPCFKAYG